MLVCDKLYRVVHQCIAVRSAKVVHQCIAVRSARVVHCTNVVCILLLGLQSFLLLQW